MPHEVVRVEHIHRPLQHEGQDLYSMAFSVDLATTSRLIMVAGQVALNEEGTLVGEGDIGAQFRQVYSNLRQVLRSAGAEPKNVISLRTLLTREEDIPQLNALRAELYPTYFGGREPPPNTLLLVRGLVHPGMLIEVEAVAAT